MRYDLWRQVFFHEIKAFLMTMTISSFNKDVQLPASRETRITPQEQLKRLLPIEEIATVVPALPLDVVNIIAKYAASDATFDQLA